MNIWRHTTGRDQLYRPSSINAARMPDCAVCPVRDYSLCRGLKPHELHRLAEATTQLHCDRGAAMFQEGDAARYLYTIREGIVRLVRSFPDGRRSVVGFLHGGDFFGSMLGTTMYSATAEAVTNTEYCRIAVGDVEALAHQFPTLELRLREMAAERLTAAEDHIVLLSRKTAVEKVAAFLLASEEWAKGNNPFDVPMSRGDIADYLGITIETVSRTLTRLVERGVIALPTPHQIEVRDHLELHALARPESEGLA